MGQKIIISQTQRQHKIALRAHKARKFREHKAFRMSVADGMRAEAKRIEEYIAEHDELTLEEQEQGRQHVLHLQSEAIAQENATCLDDH